MHIAEQHPAAVDESTADLTWLLDNFRSRTSGVTAAILATTDGLMKAMSGLGRDDADRLAAVGAGMHSVALGMRAVVGGDDDEVLRQALYDTSSRRTFVMAAAEGTLLIVVSTQETNPTIVGHEMATLVRSVRSHLATPARDAIEEGGVARHPFPGIADGGER
ncbi:Predicted regulator of Ras-like GTPase activity, Roadblock/LC7/MglB family [Actinacidiphila alni]|uniref:Predicted regulator of Ras-like GTPase activity, Roadblock/LC7/MglB family n=1 Tax=Actinacidiphila alni TaxID=380248 RepID=A0A1I2L958_9ACTN|nr:roadblock/LC7 domain-containing protein [Actinacidiphila alni]SFF75078.1 Predicted regulator of Ras-like GTPase activity, Roadblock/LC7/MglB family [Actinacidiphila alni]